MKPLFVDHPPSQTKTTLWFTGHAHKKGTIGKAQKEALAQAFKQFSDRLSAKGYPLTDKERDQWFRLGKKNLSPSISDRWIRTYKESPDKPFLHRLSVYLLLSVPRTYENTVLDSLMEGDRQSARVMSAKKRDALAALEDGKGGHFLSSLRKSLKADRRIHSVASFPEKDEIQRKKKEVESLWRRSLRAVKLTLTPPSNPFSLGEFPSPPITFKEEARIVFDSGSVGIKGLTFTPSLHPLTIPEHLVYPGLADLIKDPRSIFSSDILTWETFLFRQPPYRPPHFMKMVCSPTDPNGSGRCLLTRLHISGRHGYIEGSFQPLPGTPLDTPFFRNFLNKSVFDIHFRFYHRSSLHPVLLSLTGLFPDERKQVETILIEKAHQNNLTLCLSSGKTFECPGGPPSPLLLSKNKYMMRISVLSEHSKTKTLTGFSISSERIHLIANLSDSNGLFWTQEIKVTARGLSREEALSAAWKECAQRLSRDLSLVFFPPIHSHPGEEFYER